MAYRNRSYRGGAGRYYGGGYYGYRRSTPFGSCLTIFILGLGLAIFTHAWALLLLPGIALLAFIALYLIAADRKRRAEMNTDNTVDSNHDHAPASTLDYLNQPTGYRQPRLVRRVVRRRVIRTPINQGDDTSSGQD
jgi:hypothetical protein